MSEIIETWFDQPLLFTISERHVRGRLVRLGPTLNTIIAAHNYPPVAEKLLAEALALTVLLGSTLKDEGSQLTLQAQTGGGPIELLVCDYRGGELRGYLKFDAERLVGVGADPTLFALFGEGFLAITFDQAVTGERYQGIVPLEGSSIGDAAEHYFEQSEQIPSLIKLAARHDAEAGCLAGGLLLQHLPEGEVGRDRLHVRHDHPEWEHAKTIAATLKDEELTDPATSLETLAWRLFHEDEVRVQPGVAVSRGCRCSIDYFAGVLSKFPEGERREMADDDGLVQVDCAFCSRVFPIPLDDIAAHG
ncbi:MULTISPECIES: Hsp33 family molecular chaperone HslO [unclassified Sphingopyxis]|jgi:molecular chaperone Hsp33|uniref:Hsp33 family molecular chaperone HslO n=1 Tax=unclassified Sphingopyxis TaxID=2614943 RepID=UPI00072FCA83|nr:MULTISPECIES: Hsp33 family molecular chaperone HslO [unclassified Sphingopyxis]MBD3732790.1 Hsp33 family molecular chaperone HslO [Sphingopyxis sp.]KTE24526.1 molecular chaperone Hsp33 [Sphingopyxis sp. H057]KTE49506.1 molecular chaperone Hsp33 [Sphingopyxis sp. H071]KTE52198.1 molecular chaperone Hsp33 [Sphingopyxis sp. H073]KTE60469.1 molecular chaperone Hsp33 [Sphingopyxis sp. H107]